MNLGKTLSLFLMLWLLFVLGGCIRVTGKAGYTYQDSKDEVSTTKTVEAGVDTSKFIQHS